MPGEHFQKPDQPMPTRLKMRGQKRPNEENDTAHPYKKRKTDTPVRKPAITPTADAPKDGMEQLIHIVINELDSLSQQASTGGPSPFNQ